MGASSLFHLLAAYPVVQPPDAATYLAASGTPSAGNLTAHLLDPALPALGYTQQAIEITSSASGRPTYLVGRWLSRPLSAQTIGAGSWQLYLPLRTKSTLYALAVGVVVAQWRPGTGVIARAVSVPIYPADVQTIATTGGPTAGTFSTIWAGSVSGTIAFNASAATIQTTLNAIANIGGVTCSGGPLPSAVTVTFTTAGPEPLFTLGTNGLTGGTAPAPVFADVPPAAGAAGALVVNTVQTGTNDWVSLSTLTGSSLTLLSGDCLAVEVWLAGVLTSGTAAAADLVALSGGTGQYVPGKYAGSALTDTDAYLLAPALISYP